MVGAGSVGIVVGADALVLTGSFDVQTYATSAGWGTLPAETGSTQEPIADQGAVGDGVADDTAEVQAAMDALSSTGGVLDLSQGIFALQGTDDLLNIGNKSNITIKGGGWSRGVAQTSGLRVLGSDNANRFNAAVRYDPGGNNQDLVVRDLEIDVNGQQFGGVTTQNDDGSWIISVYVHNVGDGGAGSPLAGIKGVNSQTNNRWIGCLVENTSAAGASAVRGIWTSEDECSGSVIAHCIVIDTGHSGIILHAGDGALNTIEYNTVLRAAQDVGAACFKPELGTLINTATFDQVSNISLYRRNYANLEKNANPGNGPWAFQPETFNCELRENICADVQRAFASFDQLRKVTIEDNVCTDLEEYGIYVDANGSGDDKTGLILNNNTLSGDGEGMDSGVYFHNDFTGSIFDFDDDIDVVDNKIVDADVEDVRTTAALDGYANFTESGNGSGGTGARFVLIAPSYIGTI